MEIVKTKSFVKDYRKLPDEIKRRTVKALRLFAENPHHPSLHTKKTKGEVLEGYGNVFEGRITRDYRFLFLVRRDTCFLLRCDKHDVFFK
ncbi:hypothetical protein MNBD_NITROSPINAE03-1782 [hydrothermal vent metagenome]|uniref:Type II toxin-antitoxin system mRNA interferase toxin, RelE/StbE family n=1 Tax=hydrothermal vent metagenome TaxID=652676 RepID=A0A3B1C796_9ZZZZ|nr:hypothetical protein [Nitrospirota bacterium]